MYLNGEKGYAEMPAPPRILNNHSFVIGFWINIVDDTKNWLSVLHVFNDEKLKIVDFYLNTVKKYMYLNMRSKLVGNLR